MTNLQSTRQAILIIYISHATCFPSGARGKRWLSHHHSNTFNVYLVLTYRKMQLHIVKHMLFALTAPKFNLKIKWKAQQKKLKFVRGS